VISINAYLSKTLKRFARIGTAPFDSVGLAPFDPPYPFSAESATPASGPSAWGFAREGAFMGGSINSRLSLGPGALVEVAIVPILAAWPIAS